MAKQVATKGRPAARSARPTAAPAVWARVWPWPGWLILALLLAAGGVAYFALGRGHTPAVRGLAVLHTPDYHALAFSPTDPNIVLFGHHNGVMRSDDGGRSFRPLVGRTNFDAMNLAVNPTNPQQVLLAGHEVFQASADGGTSWQPMATNLPDQDMHALAMDPDNPSHLTAFVVSFGIFTSTDGGHTWQHSPGRVPGDVMSLTSAGGTPETLYAASMSAGVLRSMDGGASFTPVAPTLGRMVYTVVVDPASRTTVYAGADGGLFRSTDGGKSWIKLPYPAANAAVLGLSIAQPGRIMAIAVDSQGGVVLRSDDGGATWASHP